MNKAPYQKIKDAAASTGLSEYYLRKGCKDGSIQHRMSGRVYYVHIPALLEKMDIAPVLQFPSGGAGA